MEPETPFFLQILALFRTFHIQQPLTPELLHHRFYNTSANAVATNNPSLTSYSGGC
jgi:hypothetical protein